MVKGPYGGGQVHLAFLVALHKDLGVLDNQAYVSPSGTNHDRQKFLGHSQHSIRLRGEGEGSGRMRMSALSLVGAPGILKLRLWPVHVGCCGPKKECTIYRHRTGGRNKYSSFLPRPEAKR